MSSPGDPKLSAVICLARGRERLTGRDIGSQTPPLHQPPQLRMAETLVPNKDWFVSDCVFMDAKSANVVMILGRKSMCDDN